MDRLHHDHRLLQRRGLSIEVDLRRFPTAQCFDRLDQLIGAATEPLLQRLDARKLFSRRTPQLPAFQSRDVAAFTGEHVHERVGDRHH